MPDVFSVVVDLTSTMFLALNTPATEERRVGLILMPPTAIAVLQRQGSASERIDIICRSICASF